MTSDFSDLLYSDAGKEAAAASKDRVPWSKSIFFFGLGGDLEGCCWVRLRAEPSSNPMLLFDVSQASIKASCSQARDQGCGRCIWLGWLGLRRA